MLFRVRLETWVRKVGKKGRRESLEVSRLFRLTQSSGRERIHLKQVRVFKTSGKGESQFCDTVGEKTFL